jgi:AraC-like DNA-binding protein
VYQSGPRPYIDNLAEYMHDLIVDGDLDVSKSRFAVMIDNLNLVLLAGGRYRCTSAWNKRADDLDRCYKFYFPLRGRAVVEMDDGPRAIRAGNIYFLSGFRLRRQTCPSAMDVVWVHFMPESMPLQFLLHRAPAVHAWRERDWAWARPIVRRVVDLFEDPYSAAGHLRRDRPVALTCKLESLLILLLADLLEAHPATLVPDITPDMTRLEPAMAFLDEHYLESPPLARVAEVVGLAPNYLHRLFRRVFGVTPFDYMQRRRLDRARHLLTGSALQIQEIAAACGYDNPLYFSRVFARRFGLSPRALRRQEQSL